MDEDQDVSANANGKQVVMLPSDNTRLAPFRCALCRTLWMRSRKDRKWFGGREDQETMNWAGQR